MKPYTKIELAEDDRNYVYLINPEHNYSQSLHLLIELRAILAIEPIEIPAETLSTLLKSQVPVVIFDIYGNCVGRIEPNYKNNSNLIEAQTLAVEPKKVAIMQNFCWGTFRRNRRFLMRNRREGIENEILDKATSELNYLCDGIFKMNSIESLNGLMGKAYYLYYPALFTCLRYSGWGFTSRSDNSPVNRMLNFVYKLLEQSCKTAIAGVGLNPYQGIWHQSYREQLGLVSDLANEFKCYGDAIVVRCINRQYITLKDFDGYWDSDRLPPKVVQILIKDYEKKMTEKFTYPHVNLNCTYQEAIFVQAKQIALFFLEEIDEYYAIDLR
ncbi:CRISPR-associated endonuclease Cas1 [Scytonema sp. NUACC26]|uniref:CRISPR-associated endonuclease Cas1 n=1 Tax=Scytonema sp. NUACC26 TaxID=3140176 RepID=UPI0038B2F3BF